MLKWRKGKRISMDVDDGPSDGPSHVQEKHTDNHRDEQDQNFIVVIGSHIYFYSDIDRKSAIELIKAINQANISLEKEKVKKQDAVVTLHINSEGGSFTDGLAMLDVIDTNMYPIHTIVEGCAISAATLLSVAGKKRFIRKNAYMMIHQFSGEVYGTYHRMVDEMISSKKQYEHMIDFYSERTNLNKKEAEDMLKRDLYHSAKECAKIGLVDEIIWFL